MHHDREADSAPGVPGRLADPLDPRSQRRDQPAPVLDLGPLETVDVERQAAGVDRAEPGEPADQLERGES